MSSSTLIPIINVSSFISDPEGSVSRRKTADEVYQALSTFGVVYLKNHGIPQELVAAVNLCADNFFKLPTDVKMKHARRNSEIQGYEPLGSQWLNKERPADLKESYNFVHSVTIGRSEWPNEVSTFALSAQKLMEKCECVAMKVLEVIAQGLGLQDVKFFGEHHHISDQASNNATTLKVTHYPAVHDEMKPGQIRCGEHTDWGSITLIFPDAVGGFEVQTQGEWIPVPPIPETVVISLGDMMQRWTADKLTAIKHRVVFPEAAEKRKQTRHGLVYYVGPDADYVVKCLDGSDRYEPISYSTHVNAKVTDVY